MTSERKDDSRMKDTSAVLYRGGTVYSDADRFATAILIEAGTISWIGDEQGADVHERAGAAIVDLDSRLLTPAFGDAMGSTGPTAADWASHGVALVVGGSGENAFRKLGLGGIEHSPRNERARAVSRLAEVNLGEVACIDPTILDPDTDLAALATQGVPFAFGTAPGEAVSPWSRVQHALARGLSARAGFLASTRGVWRASSAPDAHSRGRLLVGTPATLAIWDHTELVTQVADEHRSAWSSDARAGLPPLPALGALDDAEWRAPICVRTVVDGQIVFDLIP